MDKKLCYLRLFLAVSIWGSLYVASRFVLEEIPAFLLLFLRFAVASVILQLILRAKKLPKVDKKDYPAVFFIGFFGYFVSNGLLLLGIQYSNASVSSLINSMNPLFILLFAWLLLKEPLTKRQIVAILVSVIGAIIALGTFSEIGEIKGVVFSLISMLLWSLVLIVIRKVTQKYSPLVITVYGMSVAAVCSLPAAIWSIASYHKPITATVPLILTILYIGVICTAFSHLLWNKCLSVMEAGRCAAFYPIQPVVSTVLGCLILGEKITLRFILGSLLIIGSLFYNIVSVKSQKS